MSLFSTATDSETSLPPRDSATVLLLRDGPEGRPEVFLVRRHQKSGFMAGAYVFPGGTVDEEDRAPAFLPHLSAHLSEDALRERLAEEAQSCPGAALHICAIRETFEEAGVLLGTAAQVSNLLKEREALLAGQSFLSWVQEAGVTLDTEALVPASRWVTPMQESRRYDARFFLAEAPPSQTAAHDQKETTAGSWWSAEDAMRRAYAGEIFLPPPTLRTLHHLEGFSTTSAILDDARRRRPPKIQPELSIEGEKMVLALPGDPRHSETEPALPGPTRIVLADGRWHLEG